MKLCFVPLENETNSYIYNNLNLIKELGISVYSFDEVKKNKRLFEEIEIFHFNWYENLDNRSYARAVYSLLKKMIELYRIKFFNKKIVWTMHNKLSHESINKSLTTIMMKFMIKKSDKIVIHSKESENILVDIMKDKKYLNKTFYIHHINYIGNYTLNNAISRESLNIGKDTLTIIFTGAVRKYKNIEILIDVFNDMKLQDCKLIIAGKPNTEEYMRELKGIIGNNTNIITLFKFLSDEELFSLINISDAMILPYDKISSLNSGSIILGFSCARTVVSPMIGTLLDIKYKDFYYGYDYTDYNDHYKRLKEAILRLYNDFINDKSILREKGQQAFYFVKENYGHDTVKLELKNLYTECYKE